MEMIRYQPDYHRAMMANEVVPYRLNCEATVDTIVRERPDIVVLATGADFVLPEVEGLKDAIAQGFAVTLAQAMAREPAFDPGRRPMK